MTNRNLDTELQQLIEIFRTESAEHLASMEAALLTLERAGRVDPEMLRALLRATHTIKGSSATVGYEAVAEGAHRMEDVLERLRDGEIPFSADLVTGLLESVDDLRSKLLGESAVVGTQERTEDVRTDQGVDATLRVNIGRLDTLLDLTAEITIARGRMSQLLGASAGGDSALAGTLWQLEQLHTAVQEEVMRLRMVPLGPGFRMQQRTVRDVARKCGKQVQLVIEGEDVEVDTSIAEGLRDPLTHMIRNAVDHGLESPAERIVAGKPPVGTVTLRATHTAGTVVIELADDGRGLDRDRILAKAGALGLGVETATWEDSRLYELIFESGFTTAAEVSSVSGRGVGMDVVRKHVRALRGTIDILSTPGAGTRFSIRLPLTVAIINGFTVGAGTDSYVLPLEAVEECVDHTRLTHREEASGVLNLRGAAVPYARLSDVFGLDRDTESGGRASLVVVRHGERRVGLVVDRLEGDCQAVIKPLAGMLQQLPGIAGSTILGNGRVALILDVAQMVNLMESGNPSGLAA